MPALEVCPYRSRNKRAALEQTRIYLVSRSAVVTHTCTPPFSLLIMHSTVFVVMVMVNSISAYARACGAAAGTLSQNSLAGSERSPNQKGLTTSQIHLSNSFCFWVFLFFLGGCSAGPNAEPVVPGFRRLKYIPTSLPSGYGCVPVGLSGIAERWTRDFQGCHYYLPIGRYIVQHCKTSR